MCAQFHFTPVVLVVFGWYHAHKTSVIYREEKQNTHDNFWRNFWPKTANITMEVWYLNYYTLPQEYFFKGKNLYCKIEFSPGWQENCPKGWSNSQRGLGTFDTTGAKIWKKEQVLKYKPSYTFQIFCLLFKKQTKTPHLF